MVNLKGTSEYAGVICLFTCIFDGQFVVNILIMTQSNLSNNNDKNKQNARFSIIIKTYSKHLHKCNRYIYICSPLLRGSISSFDQLIGIALRFDLKNTGYFSVMQVLLGRLMCDVTK